MSQALLSVGNGALVFGTFTTPSVEQQYSSAVTPERLTVVAGATQRICIPACDTIYASFVIEATARGGTSTVTAKLYGANRVLADVATPKVDLAVTSPTALATMSDGTTHQGKIAVAAEYNYFVLELTATVADADVVVIGGARA